MSFYSCNSIQFVKLVSTDKTFFVIISYNIYITQLINNLNEILSKKLLLITFYYELNQKKDEHEKVSFNCRSLISYWVFI